MAKRVQRSSTTSTSFSIAKVRCWTCAPDWGDGDRPDVWTQNGEKLSQVLLEDTEFGAWIQKSMESYGFKGVPLSYQEVRIYHWNQAADRMIGIENVPEHLRIPQILPIADAN